MYRIRMCFIPLIILILSSVLFCACAEQPCPGSERCGRDNCYWCTPMDITDENRVWEMLCAPITVIKGDQKSQYLLRSRPDKKSDPVAEVTYASQGVHVLEDMGNGWTRVETRSSSFADSVVHVYNELVTGYVETALLTQVQPNNTNYAIVIDKMTQRLYVFRDGHLFSTLLCSTGYGTKAKPYNETQSGDFLIVSPVGDFPSDNLICEMGLRFNRGNLLHQVPYIQKDDYINWDTCEKALGTKASHGCVRVQRKLTPEGVNMKWLWNMRKMNSRLVIWEDCPGRNIAFPDKNLPVYINPNGGKTYHRASVCDGVASRYLPLTQVSYSDLLCEPYTALTPCPYCVPEIRPETCMELNEKYALSRPVYTDEYDGLYYHWNAFCSSLPADFLPLTLHYEDELSKPALSFLKPCPECVEKARNPVLYYNPLGGKYYHSKNDCAYVNKRYLPLTEFRYDELNDETFHSLKPCPRCNPPDRNAFD